MKQEEYKFKASLNCILKLSGEGGHRVSEGVREREKYTVYSDCFSVSFSQIKVKREKFEL